MENKKKYMTINGEHVPFTDEQNILTVVRKAGFDLPTFCYYPELSVYGACRLCIVEDSKGEIIASCSTPPRDGMNIKINTPELHHYRKTILELLLASHCQKCTSCSKNGRCRLQDIARRHGIEQNIFDKTPTSRKEDFPVDASSRSITRDQNKCIHCGSCVRMCSEIQNIGAIDFAMRGYNLTICPAFNAPLAETECVDCGQCSAVCPTGAITSKSNVPDVWAVIHDENKKAAAQIAPAVRVGIAEEFGVPQGTDVMPLIVSAMRKIGFDEIYDTSFAADLTVVEESQEFLERLESGGKMPLFTSCCPAWVKYVEFRHPELLPQVSTCKSPQQMLGSVIKAYDKEHHSKDTRETVVVSIMPCTAKKAEAARKEFITDGTPDVDLVLTTQDLADMIYEAGIVFSKLEPQGHDMPFGMHSGAGVIFGVTGGVTEAVIRKLVQDKSRSSINEIECCGVRGLEGTKEFRISYGEKTLKIAVVNGLGNAEKLIQKLAANEAEYDFVEVMACPTGCIGGAGQPFGLRDDKQHRAEGLYKSDKLRGIRHSDGNPMVDSLYKSFLKGRTHELLHMHCRSGKG